MPHKKRLARPYWIDETAGKQSLEEIRKEIRVDNGDGTSTLFTEKDLEIYEDDPPGNPRKHSLLRDKLIARNANAGALPAAE